MSSPGPLGWIPFHARTVEMDDAHAAALAKMRPMFTLAGSAPDPGPYVNLMDTWKAPAVVQALGFEFPGIHQLTGSCVGAGLGNCTFTLQAVEVLLKNDPEQIFVPFWLFTYGISRMLIGETSEGEGSLGSAAAEAAKDFGEFGQQEPGLPAFSNNDGLTWGDKTELKWSNGKAIGNNWLQIGKKHLIKSTDPVKSAAQGRDAIRNGYPLTFASPWYMNPGSEQVKGSKEPACVGSLSGNGGHQTSILAVWDHPELGLLFWNENQWGLSVYKECPKIKRRAGCWMTERDFEKVARSGDGEIYAFSQYDGYPAQTLPWASILPFTN